MNASDDSRIQQLRASLAKVRLEAARLEEQIAQLEKKGQMELPSPPVTQESSIAAGKSSALSRIIRHTSLGVSQTLGKHQVGEK